MSKPVKQPLTAKMRDELMEQRDKALAEVERLKTLAALHWSPVVIKADVPPPRSGDDHRALSKGYVAHQHDSYGSGPEIWPACSSSVHHGLRSHEKTNSQGTISVSSTPVHALRVLRCEKESEFARRLRKIDAAIEVELAKEREGLK